MGPASLVEPTANDSDAQVADPPSSAIAEVFWGGRLLGVDVSWIFDLEGGIPMTRSGLAVFRERGWLADR